MFKPRRIFVILLLVFITINCYSMTKSKVTHSANHGDLVVLFNEFRDFDQPVFVDGIGDYSKSTLTKKYQGLKILQKRLQSIDTTNWSVSDQIDYHLLRAEMNGMDFMHRVVHPWKTSPNFYLQQMPLAEFRVEFPLSENAKSEVKKALDLTPLHFAIAKKNLDNFSEVAGDLALFAIHTLENHNPFNNLSDQLSENYPELDRERKEAQEAIEDYLVWLKQNQSAMTASGGVGKENYNWLLKNVYLMPYTWYDCKRIVELEDNRVITFREIEKNKNRNLPKLKPVNSQQEYRDSYMNSIKHVINFLKEEKIMTVQDYLVPDEYLLDRGIYKSQYSLSKPWPEKHDYFFNFSLRESLMEETHELVGHHFDLLRSQKDYRTIRGAREHQGPYNVSLFRCEGFAFALEELLMHAGYLDTRPPRAREIAYDQAAFRTVRAISDVKMHAREWSLRDAMKYCVANAPNGYLLDNSFHLWYEMETTLVEVGWHMAMVVGKVYFMKMIRDRAQQLGDDFVLQDFIDEYLSAGMIPPTLIRWEMTGQDDEIKKLW